MIGLDPINRTLLASWLPLMPQPQDELLQGMIDCLPDQDPCPVDEDTKQALAHCLRNHYRRRPEAIAMQASGNTMPLS